MKEIKSEARLTFAEATSIIVGHGVGSGILAVPYLASRNTWWDIIWIIALVYFVNLLMHYMIAELSYNNSGAQFIKCLENELFTGKAKKIVTWIAFGLLGLSVLANVSSFVSGAGAVFNAWFGIPDWAGMLLFFILAALVVLFGMKLVGIAEKISVWAMIGVIIVLLVATLNSPLSPLPCEFHASSNLLALYSMVSFSLSAVMSVPQVVKGLNGDAKRVRRAIATGTGINVGLILLITTMTLIGAGSAITQNGALVDLSASWRLGQRCRLHLLAARARHILLGKHAQSARHCSRTDKHGLTEVLSHILHAERAARALRPSDVRRLYADCVGHPGGDGHRHHRVVQQEP